MLQSNQELSQCHNLDLIFDVYDLIQVLKKDLAIAATEDESQMTEEIKAKFSSQTGKDTLDILNQVV